MNRWVLIADDEANVLEAMQEFFASQGWSVEIAATYEAAEALVTHRFYDLVLTDLSFDGNRDRQGLALARHVRAANPSTVVVVVTANAGTAIFKEAEHSGVGRVLSKPVALASLLRVASSLVDSRGANP